MIVYVSYYRYDNRGDPAKMPQFEELIGYQESQVLFDSTKRDFDAQVLAWQETWQAMEVHILVPWNLKKMKDLCHRLH
jgi:hypothetical protein